MNPRKMDKNSMRRYLLVICAITLNVGVSFIMTHFELPLFLDSIGTITASAIGGLYPGIVVAVGTNLFCSFFNDTTVFFTIINILIACFSAYFAKKGWLKKAGRIIELILLLALICGVLGAAFQWALDGEPGMPAVADATEAFANNAGIHNFLAYLLINTGLNLVDKGISVGIALLFLRFIPAHIQRSIYNSGWRQKPLPDDEIRRINSYKQKGERSLQKKVTGMLMVTAFAIALVMGWIGISLYTRNTRKEYTENARNAAKFAAEIVDPDKLDAYLRLGVNALDNKEYIQTRNMLYKIRDNVPGVEYLYMVKIENDGCYYIFDLDTETVEAYAPGEKNEFEEAFQPYLPALFAGEEIEPIESNDISGWLLTVYYPVRNAAGRTVCYSCADVSMSHLSEFVRGYIIKMLVIFVGFFLLIIAYGLWVSNFNLIYPINSMVTCTNSFMTNSDDQKVLDENVNKIKRLEIHTGDEVEDLYRAISKMTADTSEQMRDIRHYADATAQMQNGLIITMANMVENRDSDTGAHVQKTAAYVRIILEGLKRKGYYASKLTPKYMADVERSAPLHDVGKINISDTILNKPGKLTDEEYEIMKTHTIAGKKIMENAISTVQGESYLKEARNMAAYHHERWDGKGYPEGLSGEVIPLSARVMAVADVFDALSSPRVYKPAFPFEKAEAIIREGSGTQFDPKCVEVFFEAVPEIKQILKKFHES